MNDDEIMETLRQMSEDSPSNFSNDVLGLIKRSEKRAKLAAIKELMDKLNEFLDYRTAQYDEVAFSEFKYIARAIQSVKGDIQTVVVEPLIDLMSQETEDDDSGRV